MTKSGWWGHLTEDSPLRAIWTDGEVPLQLPIVLQSDSHPPSYLLDPRLCTPEQLQAIAEWIYERWKPECTSVAEALAYIQAPGLPLAITHFTGVGTTDPKIIHALIDLVRLSKDQEAELIKHYDAN